MDKLLKNYKNK